MRVALAVPLALLGASGAEARFAPRTDAAYRLTSTAASTRDADVSTVTLVRTIRFTRLRDGSWHAVAGIETVGSDGASGAGQLFEQALAALTGVPITVHLDRDGAVLDVAEVDTLWARLLAGLPTSESGRRAAALFAAIPGAHRPAILASAVSGVVGAASTERASGDRTTSLPAATVGGSGGSLPATEHVVADRRRVTVEIDASGPAPRDGIATLKRLSVIDRASGLVLERSDDTSTTITIDGEQHVSRSLQRHRLDLMVPEYPPGNPRKR